MPLADEYAARASVQESEDVSEDVSEDASDDAKGDKTVWQARPDDEGAA
jgi:hypothetical protein